MIPFAEAMGLTARLVLVFFFALPAYVIVLTKNEVLYDVKSPFPHRIYDYFILMAVCALLFGLTGLDLPWRGSLLW